MRESWPCGRVGNSVFSVETRFRLTQAVTAAKGQYKRVWRE